MRALDVSTLVEVLEGIEIPLFAEIAIDEVENGGPLRVMLLRPWREAVVDTVVITNDPTYQIGVQLWPAT